jgi:hypothetical protein
MKAEAEASAAAHNAPAPRCCATAPVARAGSDNAPTRRPKALRPKQGERQRAAGYRQDTIARTVEHGKTGASAGAPKPIGSTIRLYQRTVRSDAGECGNLSSSVWFEYKITIDDYPDWKSRPYR